MGCVWNKWRGNGTVNGILLLLHRVLLRWIRHASGRLTAAFSGINNAICGLHNKAFERESKTFPLKHFKIPQKSTRDELSSATRVGAYTKHNPSRVAEFLKSAWGWVGFVASGKGEPWPRASRRLT